jgi:hypothetical protein
MSVEENIFAWLYNWGQLDLGIWKIPILGIVVFGGLFVFLFLVYSRVAARLNRRIILQGLHPHFYNGLLFVFKVIYLLITIISFISFLAVPEQYTILVISLIVASFTISSIRAINNYIAGVWIVLIKPFSIGDYIGILDSEGVVVEITLNYTKILQRDGNISLIPNIDCTRNPITIFSVTPDWFHKEMDMLQHAKKIVQKEINRQGRPALYLLDNRIDENINELKTNMEEFQKLNQLVSKRKKLLNQTGITNYEYVQKDRLIRFTFRMSLKKEPFRNAKILTRVCQSWTTRFGLKPEWKIIGLGAFIDYLFIITTPNPQRIISFYDDFVRDIYEGIFTPDEPGQT